MSKDILDVSAEQKNVIDAYMNLQSMKSMEIEAIKVYLNSYLLDVLKKNEIEPSDYPLYQYKNGKLTIIKAEATPETKE